MLLIVFCLRRNLHEVISRGQDSMRLVPDSGKKENYKKLIPLMVYLRVIYFIGKWILEQCSSELQQSKSVALLI